MRRYLLLLALLALVLGLLPYRPAQPSPMPAQGGRNLYFPLVARDSAIYPITIRVSVSSDGTQAGWFSFYSSLSNDGRYVAFDSVANNLVPGDTNADMDIFVHDLLMRQTTRVSVSSEGTQANGLSNYPSISGDGRYVAFASAASNLAPGDSNGVEDVFVHDRQTGQTTRVSVSSDSTQGNSGSGAPSTSVDGRYVAFASSASNLVAGDTNGYVDVFVHDRQTGQTTRVSVSSDGTQGNDASYALSISGDGRNVVFVSAASNLVAGDTNGVADVFVHDRQTGQTTRVSLSSEGAEPIGYTLGLFPSISGDGRYVAFASAASNLAPGDSNGVEDVFVHDRQTGQTTRVSVVSDGTQGNGKSDVSSISSDGRYVAFASAASNLVAQDTNGVWDIFVHDRQTGQTNRVSVSADGSQGNSVSGWPSISGDGRFVSFDSDASNLVPQDTNTSLDIFVHQRW